MSNISLWKDGPQYFLSESESCKVNWETPPLVLFYQLLIGFDHRRDNDLFRSRFLKVIFYALKKKLGVERLHSPSVEIIAQIISASGLTNVSLRTIKSHVIDWSKEGKKLDLLCRHLHGHIIDEDHGYLGILFCLPEDVGKE